MAGTATPFIPTYPMSCVAALKHFFGDHPDGTTRFVAEVKALDDNDRAELAAMLESEGYKVTTTTKP